MTLNNHICFPDKPDCVFCNINNIYCAFCNTTHNIINCKITNNSDLGDEYIIYNICDHISEISITDPVITIILNKKLLKELNIFLSINYYNDIIFLGPLYFEIMSEKTIYQETYLPNTDILNSQEYKNVMNYMKKYFALQVFH